MEERRNILLNVDAIVPTPIVPNLSNIHPNAVELCATMVGEGLLKYFPNNNSVIITQKGRDFKNKSF